MLPVILSGKHMAPSDGNLIPTACAAVDAWIRSSDARFVDLIERRIFDVGEVVTLLVKRHTFPRTV